MKQNQKWIIQLKMSPCVCVFWFVILIFFFLNQDKTKELRIHFPVREWKRSN